MENDDNFDQLVDLHDHIKDFKTKVAQKVLLNFYKEVPNTEGPNAPKLAKFVKVSDYNRENDVKDEDVLNLSSSATCAYTVGEYLTLWEEANQRNAPDNFFDLTSYWNYIVKGLREPVESELQLPDEFSILNILSLLTKIENRIETSTLGKVLTDEEASTATKPMPPCFESPVPSGPWSISVACGSTVRASVIPSDVQGDFELREIPCGRLGVMGLAHRNNWQEGRRELIWGDAFGAAFH